MLLLTIVELLGFGAIAAAAGIAGHAFAGAEAGIASGLFVAGVALVYLANAYSLSGGDDAERP